MTKIAHLIGNGNSAWSYRQGSPGIKMTCNLPPFPVPDAIGTGMVDFKMMKAITEGSVSVPGEWILGFRPKIWCDGNSSFYMKHAQQIKEFYLTLPSYVENYTDFSCGHMCAHFLATKHQPDELHMYGFDSLFDCDLRSCTDFYLNSERDVANTVRLSDKWRSIWPALFNEFPITTFYIYGRHSDIKLDLPDNAEVRVVSTK